MKMRYAQYLTYANTAYHTVSAVMDSFHGLIIPHQNGDSHNKNVKIYHLHLLLFIYAKYTFIYVNS